MLPFTLKLSGRLKGRGSLYLVGSRGTGSGSQYPTNTKQYPIVHPPFCFLRWEASSTEDVRWPGGPRAAFWQSRNKTDWCNPHITRLWASSMLKQINSFSYCVFVFFFWNMCRWIFLMCLCIWLLARVITSMFQTSLHQFTRPQRIEIICTNEIEQICSPGLLQ